MKRPSGFSTRRASATAATGSEVGQVETRADAELEDGAGRGSGRPDTLSTDAEKLLPKHEAVVDRGDDGVLDLGRTHIARDRTPLDRGGQWVGSREKRRPRS